MTPAYNPSWTFASPHAHGGSGVRRTMVQVQLALLPATLFGFWLYGWPAFFLWLITLLSCLAFESQKVGSFGKLAKLDAP